MFYICLGNKSTFIFEEILQDLRTFFFHDPAFVFRVVVQVFDPFEADIGNKGAAFGILASEVYFINTGIDDGTHAHHARLQRDIKFAAFQVPVIQFLSCLDQAFDLCMKDSTIFLYFFIVCLSNDFPVFDDDTADRDFIFLERFDCKQSFLSIFAVSIADQQPDHLNDIDHHDKGQDQMDDRQFLFPHIEERVHGT